MKRSIALMLALCISLFTVTATAASPEKSWSCVRSGNKQPPVTAAEALISKYGGYSIDRRVSDTDDKRVLYLTFDCGGKKEEYFALRVRGESMLNAGILPGDLVVVHRQQTAQNGEIVVALLGEEATVKRLQRKNGEIWLLPENEAYQPIDGSEAELVGLVKAVVREY